MGEINSWRDVCQTFAQELFKDPKQAVAGLLESGYLEVILDTNPDRPILALWESGILRILVELNNYKFRNELIMLLLTQYSSLCKTGSIIVEVEEDPCCPSATVSSITLNSISFLDTISVKTPTNTFPICIIVGGKQMLVDLTTPHIGRN